MVLTSKHGPAVNPTAANNATVLRLKILLFILSSLLKFKDIIEIQIGKDNAGTAKGQRNLKKGFQNCIECNFGVTNWQV